MSLSTQPYKGARDFYPADKRLQKYMFNTLRDVVEKFGYEEYDAPILEPLELYLAKTGEEIVNEQTYTFEDRGGRRVAIRPEMTPTVSRMVAAKRQELGYPLRWYSIPNLWRYERPQRGRLREHWQLNVDLFGLAGVEAEHEIILVVNEILKTFGALPDMYTIKLNSRQHMNAIFDELELNEEQKRTFISLIDKKAKIAPEEFEKMFYEKLTKEKANKLLGYLNDAGNVPENIGELMRLLKESSVDNVVFDPSLARGFEYYTDIVFEVFDTHPDNNRSMFGGGRYDGLVGLFGVEPVPTVGFGMGDVTLANFLEIHNLLPPIRTETDVYAVLVGDVFEAAQKPIAELREMGLNVAVDLSGKKVGAQIKTAEKKGIHYIVTIGSKELENEQYPLKNLMTGVEEAHSLQRIAAVVKDYRNA